MVSTPQPKTPMKLSQKQNKMSHEQLHETQIESQKEKAKSLRVEPTQRSERVKNADFDVILLLIFNFFTFRPL